MKRTFFGIALVLLVGGTTIFAREDIRVYTVPKERASATTETPAAPITWKAPASWHERPAGDMVIANFVIAGKDGKNADVSVTTFPGDVGGELANINRWRKQLGLGDISDPGKSEAVTVGGESGKLYELENNSTEIFVASVPHNGSTWFFKVKGDKSTVESSKPAFRNFLSSIQFSESGETATSADPHADLANVPANGADPHAGLNIPATTDGSDPHAGLASQSGDPHAGLGSPTAEADNSEPKMDVPSGWKEEGPGPMVLKRYTVSGSKGGKASVSISSFPGDVGGKLANVNRWRRQMGQPEVDDSQLNTATQTVDAQGGTGYSVDVEGTDAKTGDAARLIAVAIPHDGNTWFYKILGDKNTVEESKEAFLKFVKTVRY